VIHNLLEEHVTQEYDGIVRHFPDFCGCPTCREDVLVYTLNRLPPRYVAGREGMVVSGVALDKDQNRAAIEVALMEGIRKVSLAPRCAKRGKART
jgi:competence protein ComFB